MWEIDARMNEYLFLFYAQEAAPFRENLLKMAKDYDKENRLLEFIEMQKLEYTTLIFDKEFIEKDDTQNTFYLEKISALQFATEQISMEKNLLKVYANPQKEMADMIYPILEENTRPLYLPTTLFQKYINESVSKTKKIGLGEEMITLLKQEAKQEIRRAEYNNYLIEKIAESAQTENLEHVLNQTYAHKHLRDLLPDKKEFLEIYSYGDPIVKKQLTIAAFENMELPDHLTTEAVKTQAILSAEFEAITYSAYVLKEANRIYG